MKRIPVIPISRVFYIIGAMVKSNYRSRYML